MLPRLCQYLQIASRCCATTATASASFGVWLHAAVGRHGEGGSGRAGQPHLRGHANAEWYTHSAKDVLQKGPMRLDVDRIAVLSATGENVLAREVLSARAHIEATH